MELINIEKSFGENLILDKISLTIYTGRINIILGPSGCGKSTLLQVVAGLDKDFKGSIVEIDKVKISYVFQEHCLLEWKNVEKNIMYALSGKVDNNKLLEYGEALGLSDYLKYYPKELSGGLLQRVNLLRSFLYPATTLLMDEPFKSLDIRSKEEAMELLIKVQRENNLTVLLVTHSIEEAVQLGSYIHILSSKPTRCIGTIENPYSYLEKNYSVEEKEIFSNKIKEMIQNNS